MNNNSSKRCCCSCRRTLIIANMFILLGLVFSGGAASLSSSSFTTKNGGRTTFVKHSGFTHLQSNGGKQPSNQQQQSTTKKKNGSSSSQVNGKLNGNMLNGKNGSSPNNKKRNEDTPNIDPVIHADYIADTKLPTDVGHFQLRAYRVRNQDEDDTMINFDTMEESADVHRYENTNALEPVVIYSTDKPPFGKDGKLRENVPIRIHDQCLTSEVFRSQRYVSIFISISNFFLLCG